MDRNSPDEVRQDGFDPLAAFNNRRFIYQNVRESQRLEHETLKRIANLATRHKSELLELLSDWLLDKNDTGLSEQVNLISQCSLAEWCKLQQYSKQLKLHLTTSQTSLDKATLAYRDAAPMSRYRLGKINELRSNEAQRTAIKNLQAIEKSKRRARDIDQARVSANDIARKCFGKRFLRGCLENIGQLESTLVFGSKVPEMTNKFRLALQSEWATYMSITLSRIGTLEDHAHVLRRIYGRREE